MSFFEITDPPSLGQPRGYSNGLLAPAGGRMLFVAGQIGWDEEHKIVAGGFAAQFEQALSNVLTVVSAAGGEAANLGRLTLYVTDKSEYLAEMREVGAAYRRVMGDHYPAMSLVEVAGLLETGAKVEIEGTAMLAAED
ncbi:MAG: RidA family protein [Acidobacteria bacterium]|nr:RidA family protein [Acidobacteriota bacterium]MCZ6726005.1 RidA family protein [Acidobacteriota bacterium]